jgi:CBS domain-containing protein
MMLWKNIHHTPILDDDLNLVGLLTWTDVKKYVDHPELQNQNIKEIMQKDLITVTDDTLLKDAEALMEKKNIHCLPVVKEKKLVGIITSNDF